MRCSLLGLRWMSNLDSCGLLELERWGVVAELGEGGC